MQSLTVVSILLMFLYNLGAVTSLGVGTGPAQGVDEYTAAIEKRLPVP